MRKLVLLFTVCMLTNFANAQNTLDTMVIRPAITLQAQDIAWLRGKIGATMDSMIMKSDRNINNQLSKMQGLTWATNISIDSLPGKLVFSFYRVLRKDAGENVARYSAILAVLQGVTQLTTYYNNYEAAITKERGQAMIIGKHIYLDQ